MHAFVTAVLVRGGGLDEVGQNAELDPPADRRERRPKAVDAKGVPLSERIRWGNPNSWKRRVKTLREPA